MLQCNSTQCCRIFSLKLSVIHEKKQNKTKKLHGDIHQNHSVYFVKIKLQSPIRNQNIINIYSFIELNTDIINCYRIVTLAIISLFKLTKIQSGFCFSFFFLSMTLGGYSGSPTCNKPQSCSCRNSVKITTCLSSFT